MKKNLNKILKKYQIEESDKDLIEVLINICEYYKITDAEEILEKIRATGVIKLKE